MFFANMGIAAGQVLILYLLVAVGFIADKTKIFGQETARRSNDLLFYVITPAVIVRSFLSMQFDVTTAASFGTAFLGCSATLIIGLLVAMPLFRGTGAKRPVFQYAVSYGNMGYMALPLCEALLGAEGVFYCSAGVVAFNIISFTHGVRLMTKDGDHKEPFRLRRLVLNPGVISVMIGLPLFLLGVKLPAIPQKALDYVASLNTPLAMIFLGTYIANTNLKSLFKEKNAFLVALLKLVVLPLIMYGVFRLVGITGTLLTALMISASTPSANNTVMFSAKYGKDTGLASQIVAMASLLSVFTIPAMIALSSL
ncbi:MAG: AEC family transporter [Clostridia bacterium]|nr:AEC family transporter [Clostridia bacterium]